MRIPEFGARHRLFYDEDHEALDDFFDSVHTALTLALKPTNTSLENDATLQQTRRLFRMYDDPKRVGITVLERRVTRAQSQRSRFRWSHADEGRIRSQIQDELADEELSERPLLARFTNVIRVGDADSSPKARKLGLILDQESREAEFLVREHEIVVNGIRGVLKDLREPYSPYIPHFTIARINREAGNQGMDRAVAAVQALLPLEVEIAPLTFYTEEEH
jgi:hypothetical protein